MFFSGRVSNMGQTTDEILTVAHAYAKAVRSKDVAQFGALYHDDVFVFDMWESWSMRGRAAVEAMAKGWFASLGTEQVAVTVAPLWSRVDGDRATFCATLRYAGLSAQGEELRSMENRLTWSLIRENGKWQVVHEHSSAPASFKTMQVILSAP